MPADLTVDVHAHVVPAAYLERVARGDVPGVARERGATGELLTIAAGADTGPVAQRLPVLPGLWDPLARLGAMDAARVEVQVQSPVQFMYHYWLPATEAAELARVVNDGIAEMVAARPERFVGMATLPLQDTKAAVEELERVHGRLGIRAVEIGTHIAGTPLDAEALDPFYARAEGLGVLIFVHPYAPLGRERLGTYFLRNLLGNPFETTVAMSHIFFGGVLDRFPRLRLCFAYGGGALPSVIGRLERGFDTSADCRSRGAGRPASYLGRVWYDTITHDVAALAHLISRVGASQVLVGSDYPFEIGDPDPVSTVERLDLDQLARQAILGGNAAALLGLGGR